jgi:cleavage and polyadenylation specificity factor subunit 3
MGSVDIKHTKEDELTLEWESSVTTDMIADSTLALILGIESSPASVKREFRLLADSPFNKTYLYPLVTHSPHSRSHVHADQDDEELMQQIRYEGLAAFLESHFGYAEIYLPDENAKDVKAEDGNDDPAIIIKVDDLEARVNLVDLVSVIIARYLIVMLISFLVSLLLKRSPQGPCCFRCADRDYNN